jgi:hypothetical protein
MAIIASPGIWLPGPLNGINSPSPTSQQDIAGNPYFMGLLPGQFVVLGKDEAQNVAAPGSTLYDGTYQYVQLDSGATATYATAGYAAYFLPNQGSSQGALPQNAYDRFTVTTGDVANSLGLNNMFCGIFINPTNANGVSYTPTPGNWTMIFIGGGRAAVQVGAVANVALGNAVFPDTGHTGKFQGSATITTAPISNGLGMTAGTSGNTAIAYYSDIIFHFLD